MGAGCALPQVLVALRLAGEPRAVSSLDAGRSPPPPGSAKGLLSAPLANHLETANFTVQWDQASVTTEEAEMVSSDMEAAWTALVGDQGWAAPVSSDVYLLKVVLDETIGATGYTTLESPTEYPQGVPVVYMNTTWSYSPEFMASLAAHEFGHALQFGSRDYWSGGDGEAWFWEATSEWVSELARPELDTYAWSATWYAQAPGDAHDSLANYHQYGMFLLCAFLDEYRMGPDGIRDLWEHNEGRIWVDEIASATGEDAATTWAEFAGAYRAGALRESALYGEPAESVSASGTVPGWLGADYVQVSVRTGDVVRLDDGVGSLIRDGAWEVFEGEVEAESDWTWIAVTNPEDGSLDYRIEWEEAAGDTGPDTGGGASDDPAGPTARPAAEARACGCAGGGLAPGALLPVVASVARRRRVGPCGPKRTGLTAVSCARVRCEV